MKYVFGLGLGLLLCNLVLAGCARRPVQSVSETGPQLLHKADQALEQGKTLRAQELYSRLAHSERLSRRERIQAWRGLASASRRNGHWEDVALALEQWAGLDPKAKMGWEWQSHRLAVLWARDRDAFLEHASSIIMDSTMPWTVRLQTVKTVIRKSVQEGRPGQAWPLFASLYEQTKGLGQKKELEEEILDLLHTTDDQGWEFISQDPPKAGSKLTALVRWMKTLRDFRQDRSTWPLVQAQLSRILEQNQLALEDELASYLTKLEKKYGQVETFVTLICPLSGDYAPMGWDIALGASVAQRQLKQSGKNLTLYILNSDSPDWLDRLASLPPKCQMVGGPLERQHWKTLIQSPLIENRTFFPFRSNLEPGEEGKDGFRFFPGTEDQLEPLVELLQSSFGIERYAVLSPRSDYGQRMSAAFARCVQDSQGRVVDLMMYEPNQPGSWKDVVAKLIRAEEDIDAEKRSPAADIQAVFIPDSFSQVQMLIPEFYYFDQDHLFFLGPTLWSQSGEEISALDRKYFQLAIMASPWLADNSQPAAQKLTQELEARNEGEPDFWTALGYDFVRLAHQVQLLAGPGQDAGILQSLRSVQNFSWSMAPLTWDAQGRAKQALFVVQPGANGMRPVDIEKLQRVWEAAGQN